MKRSRRQDVVNEWLPCDTQTPGKDEFAPEVDQKRSVHDRLDVFGAALSKDQFIDPSPLSPISEVDGAIGSGPVEVEGKDQSPHGGSGGKVRQPVRYGRDSASADRHVGPTRDGFGREAMARRSEDPGRGVEGGRHPAVLIRRERRARRASSFGQGRLRQTSSSTSLRE